MEATLHLIEGDGMVSGGMPAGIVVEHWDVTTLPASLGRCVVALLRHALLRGQADMKAGVPLRHSPGAPTLTALQWLQVGAACFAILGCVCASVGSGGSLCQV